LIRLFWLCSLLLLPALRAQAQEAAEPSSTVFDSVAIVHYQAGYKLLQAQNFRNAAAEFEQAVAAAPTYGDAFYALGKVYRALNEYDKAIKAYEAAKNLPLSSQVKGNPSKELSVVYDKFARKLYGQRKYQEAVTMCDKALELEPAKPEVYYVKGLSHFRFGALEEARKAYMQELQINPSYAQAHKAIGDLYRQNRSYSLAIEAYKKAIALDSTLTDAWGGVARSQMDNQSLDEALKTLTRAVVLDPKYEEGHLLMGVTLNRLGRQQDAIAPLRQAIALDGKDPEAHFRLAEAYYALGDYRNALSTAQSAVQYKKDNRPPGKAAEATIADSYLKLGQKDQARLWYQKALDDPLFKDYCAHQLEELAKAK